MPKKFPSLHRGLALSRSERMQLGPIVVGFEGARLEANALPELARLSEIEVIRLVELMSPSRPTGPACQHASPRSRSEGAVAR